MISPYHIYTKKKKKRIYLNSQQISMNCKTPGHTVHYKILNEVWQYLSLGQKFVSSISFESTAFPECMASLTATVVPSRTYMHIIYSPESIQTPWHFSIFASKSTESFKISASCILGKSETVLLTKIISSK